MGNELVLFPYYAIANRELSEVRLKEGVLDYRVYMYSACIHALHELL